MPDRIEREMTIDAAAEEVWEAVTGPSWLAEEVVVDLRPGGGALFRSAAEVKTGWVEEVLAPERLAFWWAADGEPPTRVELTLTETETETVLRIVETRPLDRLDLIGTPLPGAAGRSYGPALVAA
jgi:uncharacterized protein YndB with AHSA1/START domain